MKDFLESVTWHAGDPTLIIQHPAIGDDVVTDVTVTPRQPGDYSAVSISITSGAVTTEMVEVPLSEIERIGAFFAKVARWARG